MIPSNPSVNFVALVLVVFGFFLFLAGANIIKVEKVSVKSGFKTWFIGLIMIGIGGTFFIPKELLQSFNQPSKLEFKDISSVIPAYKKGVIHSQVYVVHPPANIFNNPNGEKSLCKVGTKQKIYIDKSTIKGRNGKYWYRTNICGEIGYVYYSDIAPSYEKDHHIVKIIDPPSNVREKPNLRAKILCKLSKAVSINTFGKGVPDTRGKLWFKTDVCRNIGYISELKFSVKY